MTEDERGAGNEDERIEAEKEPKKKSRKARYPADFDVVFKGFAFRLGDYVLEDLFSRYHPYMKRDYRISHAIVLWRDYEDRPLYLVKSWAPAELLTPDELSRGVYYESDLDWLVAGRGVEGGAVRSWETFHLWEVEDERDRRLLELKDDDLAVYAGREFYDKEGVCLCYQRQWITAHHPFGLARDFRIAKGMGITTEW